MKSTVESSIQAMVEKTQAQYPPPTTLPNATPVQSTTHHPQTYNINYLDNALLDALHDDLDLTIMDLLPGDLTNVQSPLDAARDEDVHPGGTEDPPETAPIPGATPIVATTLHAESVGAPLLSSPPHLNDERTYTH
jgi:hypothetical protein